MKREAAARRVQPESGPARGKRARRVIDRAPRFRGWETSDEEEIERRRERAAAEPFAIEALEPDYPVLGTFRIASAGGGSYEVEIRSLVDGDNSCGCPDHQTNGLGTCKHVEAVLLRLSRRAKRRSKADGPARVEVFLRRTGPLPEVRVRRPDRLPPGTAALLGRHFDAAGALHGDPLEALPELARAVAASRLAVRARVRLSRHLVAWVEDRRRRAAARLAREQLLAEVAAGHQSLDVVRHPLFPYQQEGMLHLAFTERALLADEMGLGKTVQAIAACALLRRLRGISRVLVVCPASLKGEWEEQIARFTDLPVHVVQGTRAQRLRQHASADDGRAFFHLVNYEQVRSDAGDINRLLAPDVVILDEAQRIKNWQSQTAAAVKRLRSTYAFVLTGTPLENRIDEVYSIVQFLDPALLGPLFRFNREFYLLDERGRPAGYQNLDELRRRLAPVLLRRRKSEVEGQLPGRTDKHYFVAMEPEQSQRYVDYEERAARLAAIARRRPLTPKEHDQLQQWLACMRMICDTPYILDPDCRLCPKLVELEEILREVLADPQAKVLIFSEWERMLELVRELAAEMAVGFAWHTGSVPQAARRREIRRFKDDPDCRLFLSTDSGGVGLNLQAANIVIHLDLPWNPARFEQRVARAWRKHQTRPVQVISLVTEDSIEQRMIPLLAGKQALADTVLDGDPAGAAKMPLPSGRQALVERLEAMLGSRPATASPAEPPAELPDPAAASAAAPRAAEAPPAIEQIDRATLEAIERLAAAGLLQLTAEGHRLLQGRGGSDGADPTLRAEQARRDARRVEARAAFPQVERKLHMAELLAGGGFALEALPALREGVELALRLLAGLRDDPPATEASPDTPVPLAWVEQHRPAAVVLVAALRGGPEVLLAAGEDTARLWLRSGSALCASIGAELGSPP
jgi:superfamily II DNA or RNA helicase